MDANVREQRNDSRPYWKVAVSLTLSLVGTVLFVYIGVKAIFYFMPFVIGWFLAFVASPLVSWLEKRLKIVKKLSSAIIIVLVLGACLALGYLALSKLWSEIVSLINNFPQIYRELEAGLHTIGERSQQFLNVLPEQIRESWYAIVANLDKTMGEAIGKISEPTVAAAGSIAKSIPSVFIATIVTIISAYFFIAEREDVIIWAKRISPEPLVRRMTMIIDNLKYAAGGYFKAQIKIMGVIFVVLLVGFSLIGIHFSILLALGIALLDFLPFFGTGTALIPWALYKLMVGDYRMMVALLVLYGVTQLLRQIIQPKLVGDSMGLNPLFTLILLYVGYKVGGVFGMIIAVPLGMIVVNLHKAGAFDYILDDLKILMKGIAKLRGGE